MRDDEASFEDIDELLHDEHFVHVSEWMRQRGLAAPLPLPCVITTALWQRLGRIPFRIVQSTTLEDRAQHLLARARACLAAYDLEKAYHDQSELTLAFSASLPCRAEDPSRQILHLRFSRSEALGRMIALGLPEDLPLPPREPVQVDAYR